MSLLTHAQKACHSALQSHVELEKCVLTLLKQRKLQAPAAFVSKVLQLFETLNVRFGVMLVGPTGSGKSEVHRTLQVGLGWPHCTCHCSAARLQPPPKKYMSAG